MRSIIGAPPSAAESVIVTDMEAGLEHLSRSTTRHSDVMLVVAEPYYKSLETAARVTRMARDLGIPQVFVVANKVRTPRESEAIEAFCAKHDLALLATIPYDEQVAESSLIPRAPLDHSPDSGGVAAVAALARRLVQMQLGSGAAF